MISQEIRNGLEKAASQSVALLVNSTSPEDFMVYQDSVLTTIDITLRYYFKLLEFEYTTGKSHRAI